MSEKKTPLGRPRKYKYLGDKKNITVRATDLEKEMILSEHESIQEFFQKALNRLKNKQSTKR